MSNLNDYVSNKVIDYLKQRDLELKSKDDELKYIKQLFNIQECCNKNHHNRPLRCMRYTKYGDKSLCRVCFKSEMCTNCTDKTLLQNGTVIYYVCCECYEFNNNK